MIWKLKARRAIDDLNSSLTQEFAYAHDGAEHGAGEADSHSENNATGHYQPQGFVLGCEAKSGIRMNSTFIQRPGWFQ